MSFARSLWRRLGVSVEDLTAGAVGYLALVGLVAALAFLQPGSLSYEQTTILASQALVVALLAAAQTVVLLTGGIDLSVGGALSVINCLVAKYMTSDALILPMGVAILLCAAVIGLINGALVVYARMQPFIATLGTWFVWTGVALLILTSPGGTVAPSLSWLAAGSVAGIDVPLLLLLLLAAGGGVFLRTRLGLSIRALGSDRQGAIQSGIREHRTLLIAYTIAGLLTGVAGILLSAQNMAGDPGIGNTYLLPVITAAVIGGASLAGGRGGVAGNIVGALVLTYVASVTFAAGLPSQWSLIFTGVVLMLAVGLQHVLRTVVARVHGVAA